jgi:hypothetical protein
MSESPATVAAVKQTLKKSESVGARCIDAWLTLYQG